MSFRFFLVILFITNTCYYSYGQEGNYSISTIPESLTKSANAVVRLDETIVKVSSAKQMEISSKRIITVLNENGNAAVNAYAYYDPSRKIKKIEAYVYDKMGKEVKKFKKNDFGDVSAVSGFSLYEDDRIKYMLYTPTNYPYTVTFTYTMQTENTAFILGWSPIESNSVSLEKSTYEFSYSSDIGYRKKEKNFTEYDIIKKEETNKLSYELVNIPGAIREELSPAFYKVEPSLMMSLNKFNLEGVEGEAIDWKSLGEWQYKKLLTNRDELPQETINKVSQLLSGIESPIEKAKKIYQYVQDNTRYISVQLGIGGWMPISAKDVDEVKYGDCKGLTNYTKALLKSQGIDAYYSVVYAGDTKRNMEPGFASMQGNHVILNVPNGDEDVWLECTSQVLPFGFLGDFTDDRDVLVLTPEGGKIKHTQTYLNEENKMLTTATYSLSEDGTINGEVQISTKGIQYDDRFSRISFLADKKKDEFYKTYWKHINNLDIENIKLENDRDNVKFTETLKVSARKYGERREERILFQLNAFNCDTYVPKRYRNRKQTFEIARGYLDEDEFVITLPETFSPEELIEPVKVESKFGTYEMSVEMKSDTELLYKRKLLIKKGTYSEDDYNQFRNFKKQVVKGDKQKLVLIKQKA